METNLYFRDFIPGLFFPPSLKKYCSLRVSFPFIVSAHLAPLTSLSYKITSYAGWKSVLLWLLLE